MSNLKLMISALAVAGLVGLFSFAFPAEQNHAPGAVAQVVGPAPKTGVDPNELELYIDVYKTMQTNRDLKIDEVLKTHGISLGNFRNIERRVQKRSSLIDRVRTELREHAEQSSLFPTPPDS